MTQEEKELLLKDLCARLPYGVIVKVSKEDNGSIKSYNKSFDAEIYNLLLLNGGYTERGIIYHYSQFSLKPYLRPLSSMTEEEKDEIALIRDRDFKSVRKWINDESMKETGNICPVTYGELDFCNKKHFDYRSLIPMGLALEAPEDMYDMTKKILY